MNQPDLVSTSIKDLNNAFKNQINRIKDRENMTSAQKRNENVIMDI
jgi:hypothetical protein